MLMKTRLPIVLGVAALAFLPTESPACTRAVYLGPEGMTVTGRTMDWREDPLTNLYIFPRGTARRGANTDNTVFWTSKYGTLSAAGYDIGITDGMNEAGLVANLLFLPESVYERPGDTRPVMGLSIWTQYVLDNFATVDEAVAELSKEKFRIDAPDLPNGVKSRLHLAISDASGDSAIFEYVDGRLSVHHGREYQVMTNSPFYDRQLAILDYWQQIGGLTMLPGTNRAPVRFALKMRYTNNHFLTLAEPFDAHTETIISYRHTKAIRQLPTTYLSTARGKWLEIVHEDNVSNDFRINIKVWYIPLLYGRSFADFGLGGFRLSCARQWAATLLVVPARFFATAVRRLRR